MKEEIREERVTCGAIDLKDPESMVASPEKVSELQQKVRELQVLRKRWWKERQEDHTTVRRAAIANDLAIGEEEEVEEQPPMATQVSLFQRILSSMTLP